jgi:hypothetical protein
LLLLADHHYDVKKVCAMDVVDGNPSMILQLCYAIATFAMLKVTTNTKRKDVKSLW